MSSRARVAGCHGHGSRRRRPQEHRPRPQAQGQGKGKGGEGGKEVKRMTTMEALAALLLEVLKEAGDATNWHRCLAGLLASKTAQYYVGSIA